VAAVQPNGEDSETAKEKLAGKMKIADYAVLISFKPSCSNLDQPCFLWRNNQLERLAGSLETIEDTLQENGYRAVQTDVRVVSIPFTANIRINIAAKEKDLQTDFLVSAGVRVTVYVKKE
jgi:hypothetical protein